jgi:predicted membrane protein
MVDKSRAVIGMLLVLGGVVFLLDAADVLPARRLLSEWWPLILVALGLYVMFSRPRSMTGGGVLVAIGAVLLLGTLDILDVALWQLIIPVILIGIGLSLVIRGFGGGGTSDRRNRVNLVGVLSEQRVRSEANGFRSASLTSILGEETLDLRNATLDPSGAQVDVFCLLGDTSILVPRGWRVTVSGVPILGDFEDQTDHATELPADAPELTVTGVSILAEVDVKHG